MTEFDAADDSVVTGSEALAELRAAAAARREADSRVEGRSVAGALRRCLLGVIGAQLGMTRQGARQRFERLTTS